MRRPDLDAILRLIYSAYPGVSDVIFCVGRPFQVEDDGELKPVGILPGLSKLTPFQTETIALNLLGENKRALTDLVTRGACDSVYQIGDELRFRVNVFRQRGQYGIVMRKTESIVPTFQGLSLPPVFQEICREKSGLVLITGATASGKTTTLSAMLEEINATQAVHVITLEDPVEFIHEHGRASFTQRELGADFDSFGDGLRSAMRQSPKVIMVGEMRDRETVESALTAAETGHLVLSTLPTINAGQAINRMVGMFDASEQPLVRLRLTETARWIISQRLVPKIGGGRHLVQEIMGSNFRTREAIQQGESENRTFSELIEATTGQGWCSFDQSLIRACLQAEISEETALLYATHRAKLARMLDDARKRLGKAESPEVSMRLDSSAVGAGPSIGEIRLTS